jgi:putative SOS response-associated peptidase YedK
MVKWGLVPRWAKDPSMGARMNNARAETVAEKPAYRDALARRRCLVLADGFYECQARPGKKSRQPYWITRADKEPFAFAGLWATWHAPDESVLRTCTIVTTDANAALTAIHDRMPVILPDEQAEATWLDPATPPKVAQGLLLPLPDDAVRAREVGYAVSDARHDEPDCLDPPEPEAEPSLF